MMRILKTALIALPLGACASLTPANISAEISTIQTDAQQLCGVIPATLDVAALLTGNAVAGGASQIASAICNEITALPSTTSAKFGGKFVVVNGHKVHYK